MVNKNYCMASFLLYRRVLDSNIKFSEKADFAKLYEVPNYKSVPIRTSEELEEHLRNKVNEATKNGKVALALSGGIDSAILAKMMPKGSTAYTFKCVADGVETVDETGQAAKYAKECGLIHKVITINWDDMKKYAPLLMEDKGEPIHSIEVQLYMAGLQAKKDGFDGIIYGESADDNYGGLNKLLSKDWTTGELIERYTFVKPWLVMRNPQMDFTPYYDYDENGYINMQKFLSEFDIIESVNSYLHACDMADIDLYMPFASSYLAEELDIERIRNGENKYLIRQIFNKLYPGWGIPAKLPMPRATNEWLKDWEGPKRPEFLENCVTDMTGDQKWLLWALERYLDIVD